MTPFHATSRDTPSNQAHRPRLPRPAEGGRHADARLLFRAAVLPHRATRSATGCAIREPRCRPSASCRGSVSHTRSSFCGRRSSIVSTRRCSAVRATPELDAAHPTAHCQRPARHGGDGHAHGLAARSARSPCSSPSLRPLRTSSSMRGASRRPSDSDELGLLSAAYQLGYRVAIIVTDALILISASHLGWPVSYGAMGVLMAMGIIASMHRHRTAAVRAARRRGCGARRDWEASADLPRPSSARSWSSSGRMDRSPF